MKEFDQQLESESNSLLAEIYLSQIIEKINSGDKVEAAIMLLNRFDKENPLLNKLRHGSINPVSELDICPYSFDCGSGDTFYLKVTNKERLTERLPFVKALKDFTGQGLRETKDNMDYCTPNSHTTKNYPLVYNSTYEDVIRLRQILEELPGGVTCEIGWVGSRMEKKAKEVDLDDVIGRLDM